MKKSIPEIREREGNEKIHSHNSGKGIRGFHSCLEGQSVDEEAWEDEVYLIKLRPQPSSLSV